MTEYHDNDHNDHHIHHHYHHHYHHYYHNPQENIYDTTLVAANSTDPVDPKSIDLVEPKSTDQDDCKPTNMVNPECTDPVKPKSTDQKYCMSTNQVNPKCTNQVNLIPTDAVDPNPTDTVDSSPSVTDTEDHTECNQEDETEVMLKENTKKDPKPKDPWLWSCIVLILSLVIYGVFLITAFRPLKILLIIEYSSFVIIPILIHLHAKFCPYNKGSSTSHDAPKDIKPNLEYKSVKDETRVEVEQNIEDAAGPIVLVIIVLVLAFLMEILWILKLAICFPLIVALIMRIAYLFEPHDMSEDSGTT